MLEVGSARGYCHSLMLAKAVEEGLYPKGVLLGEDITDQRGTMVAMDFLEKYYLPLLKHGLEPIRAAGCRPVWHSDGNVLPMIELLLEAGVQGFQGYQPECGVTLERLVELRTREGEPLLLFGPLAVTTELPRMTPDQVIARIHEAQELCRGRASLVVFTSNTICPDVPLANIRAMHEAVGA
jgi:uroporphyrinogen decarboxylase